MMPNIAIGPVIKTEKSGTQIHVSNIIKFSKYNLKSITNSTLSIYYRKYSTKYVHFLRKYHIEKLDLYGLYLSHFVLPKYDLIHLHGHPYWPELYRLPKKRHAKYVHTVHQIYSQDDYDKKIWQVVKYQNERMFRACLNSDIVISVSKWLQQELKEYNIDSIHIPNGVNIEESKEADASLFRGKYNIKEDFFLFVGRAESCKQVDLFIKLAKKMPDKLFVMCGISGVSIPRNIITLSFLPHNDVLNAMAACKVLIMPSSRESCPTVLLEAMACKKPVVATNSTGMKEIITNSKDGYLFEKGNVEDLYEKACKAWKNPKLGLNGYKKVKEKYDWKIVIKQIDMLYEKLTK